MNTKLLTAGLAATMLLASAANAVTIDTTSFWDGYSAIGSFGGSATGVYGEAFTAPGGALNSFTFHVNTSVPLNVVGQVYAWSGALTGGNGPQGATGSALFTSSAFTVAATEGGFGAVTVNTGGVALTTGNNYVILLADLGGDGGNASWAIVSGHPVAFDGGFQFYNNDYTLGSINTSAWDSFGDFGSLSYSASFGGAVPEPASWALLITGFGLVGAAARRRRQVTLAA